jgi:hypothetical protein
MPDPESQLKDVFLSYSTADQRLIDRIRVRLDEDRISYFFAPADIEHGANFVSALDSGLNGTQVLLAFISKASLRSFWAQQEWAARLVQMSTDRSRRLIPVLLPETSLEELPPLLRPMNALDFRHLSLGEPAGFTTAVDRLVHAIRDELPDPSIATLRAAFVVCAMTDRELAECLDGSVFEDPRVAPIEKQRFADLCAGLAEHGIDDLRPYYRPARDRWRPIILPPHEREEDNHIRATIGTIVARLNDEFRRSLHGKPVLHPQFFSTDFLGEDAQWRQRTWDELGRLGCVLVIDAVSMYHPRLARRLSESEFGSNPKASIVVVSPLGPDPRPWSLRIETELGERLQRAFDRYQAKLDAMCEFGVGSARALHRWLFSTLPQAVTAFDQADPDLRTSMREMMREEIGQPHGIDARIFRRRK